MIGVSVQAEEREAASEFFELCKTPWEFYEAGGTYDVLLCTVEPPLVVPPLLKLVFRADGAATGSASRVATKTHPGDPGLVYLGQRLPLYGSAATFPGSTLDLVRVERSQETVIHAERTGGLTVVRVGYDLFVEVRHLLTSGQPIANAGAATLYLHLALMRDLITRAGLPLVEIPPVPEGHQFMACLTHDIDHPTLRNHRWDHTMYGFLYRATVGSLLNLFRGRLPVTGLLKNWLAAIRLPLIHLGLARDFWRDFVRCYQEIETGLGATYFVIPERDYAGSDPEGAITTMRASGYEITEVIPEVKAIVAGGNELGLHGLDAWKDAAAGRKERAKVNQVIGPAEIGVRMHWLYYDRHSPGALEDAGFPYDSSVGYNETVGYRAGTSQVYRPPGATHLLELPLHVMDTAMFFPGFLNLGDDDAWRLVSRILDHAAKFGGVVTVNWHDRSIAPDRLWGGFYRQLLGELKRRQAWFPTAAQAVGWFRKRRQAAIELIPIGEGRIQVRGLAPVTDSLPGLRIRIHRPLHRAPAEALSSAATASFLDVRFDKATELNLN